MRKQLFDRLATALSRHFGVFLIGGAGLTGIAALVLILFPIRIETRVMDLVPADEPSAQEFNDIVRQYASASQIIVGIKGGDRQQKIAFARALKERAHEATYTDPNGQEQPYVKRVTIGADTDFIAEHGLLLTKKRDLENFDELFADLRLVPLLTAYNDFFEREYIEDSASVTEREKEDRAINGLKGVVRWLEGIELAGRGDQALPEYVDQVTDLLSIGDPYIFSEDDQLMLVMVQPAISFDQMEETMDGVRALRDGVVADILTQPSAGGSSRRFADLNVTMTGMPVLALEEGEVAAEDMGASSLIALVLVLALFVLAFRMWTAPLLAVLNLVLGIFWTTGVVALVFGRLNLLTAMFAVILIGLGIDFAIHLNAAFSTARSEGKDLKGSLLAMFHHAGAGVLTGALTTSAAFFALALTGLDALVELGVTLGVGILLTLLSSMTVLPAMYALHVRVSDRLFKRNPRAPKPVRLTFPVLADLGALIGRRPWLVLIAFLLITAGLGTAMKDAAFQPDMLEIEPPDMPSVVLHREVLERFEIHPDYAMFTEKELDTTRTAVKRLKKNRLVGRVDAITEYVPSVKEQQRRLPLVNKMGDRMRGVITSAAPGTPTEAPPAVQSSVSAAEAEQLLSELERLQMNVQEMGQLAFTSVKKRLKRACDRLTGGEDPRFSRILALKNRLAQSDTLSTAVGTYQRHYLPRLAQKLARMANPTPITVDSLPAKIRERYLSDEGSNLVTIYAAVDLWHEGKTELFLSATKKASDRVTGTAVLVDRLIALIGSKGLMATFLALGTVFIILLIDFRHLGYAVLGMVPLLAGFTWMMGLFVLLGKKFDVINVEAIPLILGIGIDDAVHVLHSIRRQGIGQLPNVLRHTGRALLLTSLTTGIAFGAIAFSAHIGMAGMGQLLVLGVASCFLSSVVLLPALMRIFIKDKPSNEQGGTR